MLLFSGLRLYGKRLELTEGFLAAAGQTLAATPPHLNLSGLFGEPRQNLWDALSCSGLLWVALDCSGLFWVALICCGLLRAALGCSGLIWAARLWAPLPWAALNCSGARWAAAGCSGLLWAALGCCGLLRIVLGCSGLLWAALGCSKLWAALGCSRVPITPARGSDNTGSVPITPARFRQRRLGNEKVLKSSKRLLEST